MHYCIISLKRNNNEILQYWTIINDIALLMHYRALMQMPEPNLTQLMFQIYLPSSTDLKLCSDVPKVDYVDT